MERSHPQLEGLSEREIYEGMSPDDLLKHREHLIERYNVYEQHIFLVNDVLDGYGVPRAVGQLVLGEE